MSTCGTGRVVRLPVVQVEWCVYLWYREGCVSYGTSRVVGLPVVGVFTCGTGRVACLPVVQVEWCIYLWYR